MAEKHRTINQQTSGRRESRDEQPSPRRHICKDKRTTSWLVASKRSRRGLRRAGKARFATYVLKSEDTHHHDRVLSVFHTEPANQQKMAQTRCCEIINTWVRELMAKRGENTSYPLSPSGHPSSCIFDVCSPLSVSSLSSFEHYRCRQRCCLRARGGWSLALTVCVVSRSACGAAPLSTPPRLPAPLGGPRSTHRGPRRRPRRQQ